MRLPLGVWLTKEDLVTKTNRSRRRLPTRVPPPSEPTRALLLRFCRWAQAHPDLTDGEEAFVERFMRETAPTFGRPAGASPVAPPVASHDAPQLHGAARAVETEAGEVGGGEGAPGGDVGVGQFIGAIVDRMMGR